MLTGKQAFQARRFDTLAAILRHPTGRFGTIDARSARPPAAALPGERSQRRLRDIGDARIEIGTPLRSAGSSAATAVSERRPSNKDPLMRGLPSWSWRDLPRAPLGYVWLEAGA
jgi:hypothetical protein